MCFRTSWLQARKYKCIYCELKFSNLTCIYRAITLSSVIGRLLELLILNKEGCSSLVTSNLQLGFKKHCSTTLCTGLLKEIATHFLHNGSNVYALFLDASKAFDRVDYLLLFKRLLSKNMNSVYLRSLMNLYLNHKLRVRWNTSLSNSFEAANGSSREVYYPLLSSALILMVL